MTPTHSAALVILHESFDALRASVAGLDAPALDWHPWQGANSLAVLVGHAASATSFLAPAAAGQAGSFEAYRDGRRAAAFALSDTTAAALQAMVDAAEQEVTAAFERAAPEHLSAIVRLPGSPSDGRSGAVLLFHAVAHLREHVGHAQAVRDLWDASRG